jgi:hypothetical protein
MLSKLEQISKSYGVQTRAVTFDFASGPSIQDYKEMVQANLADLDIALLFLNAA